MVMAKNSSGDVGSERTQRRRRRPLTAPLILLSILVVLAGAGWAYVHFWLSRPVGSGPAGPAVPRGAFASPWVTRRAVLLGVGDSVTAGFGATEGRSYFDRLVRNPADEFEDMRGICLSAVMPKLESRNIAGAGTNSIQHVQHLAQLKPYPADVLGIVVISTGGNDIIHSYGGRPPEDGAMFGASLDQARPWIQAFEHRLDGMLRTLRRLFPGGCHVFLANIYDFTDGTGDVQSAVPPFLGVKVPHWPDGLAVLEACNRVIAGCAERHSFVRLVDIHAAFLGHGIHCRKFWVDTYRREDPYYWYQANFEDPNDRGYDALRRLFLLEMVKALGRAGAPAPARSARSRRAGA